MWKLTIGRIWAQRKCLKEMFFSSFLFRFRTSQTGVGANPIIYDERIYSNSYVTDTLWSTAQLNLISTNVNSLVIARQQVRKRTKKTTQQMRSSWIKFELLIVLGSLWLLTSPASVLLLSMISLCIVLNNRACCSARTRSHRLCSAQSSIDKTFNDTLACQTVGRNHW